MHGLYHRSVQSFLADSWGHGLWAGVQARLGLPEGGFEPLVAYDPALIGAMMAAAATALNRTADDLYEDLGTWLICRRGNDALRRLMRFGGVTFAEFLQSLTDLPARGRLALADFNLPALAVADLGRGCFQLTIAAGWPGAGHVALGLLRAMADDYGALAMLTYGGRGRGGAERVDIHLLDAAFAVGRRFDLAVQA